MAGMFDKAMAPDVKSWQLGADGAWLCTGDRDYQAERLAEVGENAG
jgi:polyphosphate kinase